MPPEYFAQQNASEMQRLDKQSKFLFNLMGGVLPELPTFEGINTILDIACGPGNWLDAIARMHPSITLLGIDSSARMIQMAQAKANLDHLTNLTFEQRDATQFPYPYGDASFDLINASLIYSFLLRERWPDLIQECYRLLRPGGYLRIIQEDGTFMTNCTKLHEFHRWGCLALYRAGVSFYKDQIGIIPRLQPWFEAAGFVVVSKKLHPIDVSQGEKGHKMAFEDYRNLLANMIQKGIIQKYGVATQEELQSSYEQLIKEMRDGIPRPDGRIDKFTGFWHFYSIVGQKLSHQ